MRINKVLFSALLAGTILAMPVTDACGHGRSPSSSSSKSSSSSSGSGSSSSSSSGSGSSSSGGSSSGSGEKWQTGGLSTNQVSDGTAKAQKTFSQIVAYFGLATNTLAMISPYWTINFDFCGIVLDAILLNDAKHRKGKLSEDIPELQAAVRQIGSAEELEGECEGDATGTCNEVSAKLDGTEVHVATLQNVGLEAIVDITESILKEPEELVGAAPYIQSGFGTTTPELSDEAKKQLESLGADATESTEELTTLTDEESQKMDLRKNGHLQFTGTAGVARADLGTTVAEAERNQYDSLSSYVGSGNGLVANIKVLCGLDLTLAQRLNLLNMLYGQQAANEAATALQQVQNK